MVTSGVSTSNKSNLFINLFLVFINLIIIFLAKPFLLNKDLGYS